MGLFSRIARKRKRQLFQWCDGSGRTRFSDPIVVWMKLDEDKECDLAAHGPLAAAGDAESQQKCVAAIRRAVNCPEYSEDHPEGLTFLEAFTLLGDFIGYVEELKKNTAGQQITSLPTDDCRMESGILQN